MSSDIQEEEEEEFSTSSSDGDTSCDESESDSKFSGSPMPPEKKRRIRFDPTNVITDEMLEEEKRLNDEGVGQEEMRIQNEKMHLNETPDQTREKRYEKLKYLLSKSTMYKDYLVSRIQRHVEQQKQLLKENLKVLQEKHKREQKDDKGSVKETSVKENNDEDQETDEETDIFTVVDETAGYSKDAGSERCIIKGTRAPIIQPKLLEGGILRPYQVEGYNWLKVHYENGVNGILADEMGLGKTIQCVALLSHLVYMGICGPFLVCAPLSTLPNWLAEFKRFAPKVPTVLYHGHKIERDKLLKKIKHRHKVCDGVSAKPVVITSYEIAMIDRRYLDKFEWKYLIVDEGHRVKNTHCRLVKELRMYHCRLRLLLTGTPLQNNLAELWSLLNFIVPEIFDDMGSFEQWFDVDHINGTQAEEAIVEQEKAENILSMLHQILSSFMLRRLKSDVELEIPPKKEVLVFAPLTQLQKEYYSALVDKTIFSKLKHKNKEEELVEMTASGRPKRRLTSAKLDYGLWMETDEDKKLNKSAGSRRPKRQWKDVEDEEKELENWVLALAANKTSRTDEQKNQKTSQVHIRMQNVVMELRKCCNHPYLLEHPLDPSTGDLSLTEDMITASGKMLVLDKMLVELKKREHRVLIFSQMTRMLDLIEDFCNIRSYDYCRLDGSTHIDDRRDSVRAFNESKSDKFLFLLSTKAGGLGINLTSADTVIVYDSDWNPQCDVQAQDRCHRIGQRKPVVVYRFVTANTVDQKIVERAAAKKKLEKMVIHKGKFKSGLMTQTKPMSPEELRDLLQSKDYESSEINSDTFTISKTEMNSLLDRSDLLQKWRTMKKAMHAKREEACQSLRVQAMPTSGRSSQDERKSMQTAHSQSKLFKVMDNPDSSSCESEET